MKTNFNTNLRKPVYKLIVTYEDNNKRSFYFITKESAEKFVTTEDLEIFAPIGIRKVKKTEIKKVYIKVVSFRVLSKIKNFITQFYKKYKFKFKMAYADFITYSNGEIRGARVLLKNHHPTIGVIEVELYFNDDREMPCKHLFWHDKYSINGKRITIHTLKTIL